MDVWDSIARNLNTLAKFDRHQFDGKKAQAQFNILLRDHGERNNASQRTSGVDEEVTEKTIHLDDLSALVEEAKQEDMRRAASEMMKVLTLMNDANKNELELRKFMFKKELEERQKEREAQAREREAHGREREAQLQQILALQTTMTALITTLVIDFDYYISLQINYDHCIKILF
ncbi:hypothetical protein H310_02451 [Aphanomyces invadans]|uniref:Uncharacterized protein n=1 Tax=Aphanomyces invadans TaxID=157072 RepID=A0A024UP55_9STRA|nr:hypothetical protein H310_02451 [Aphanomyces invadans]ETW08089.1 hypothetical protein H310_02451 [Aphanomyces invadans]|eukprot:XP_008864182.1 hypothetical protein H310_02451 [Aphanomyces invadans]